MKIKGTSAGVKIDLFDRCGHLTLTAATKREQELLALIMSCFVREGTMEVESDGKHIAWIVCEHEWEGKKIYVPGEPDDYVEYCKKCGTENPGSYTPGDDPVEDG